MYSLIRLLPARDLVLQQVPALASPLLIAELFYKFHSFTLECVAFLATWFVLDGATRLLIGRGRERGPGF